VVEGLATAATKADPGVEAASETGTGSRSGGLDRLASFRITYLAIFAFMMLYILSVEGVETALFRSFRDQVEAATRVNPADAPIVTQIQNRVSDLVQGSPWIRYGGVRVNVTVLGADGLTPLYVGGGTVVPPPLERSLDGAMREWFELLPAIADVYVSVPHGSLLSTGIFIGYGAVLVSGLFFYNRRLATLEEARLQAAVSARDRAADRARSIEEELSKVSDRLREVEPVEAGHAEEIDALERERGELRAKLRELADRESALRATASRANELEDERQALEELLEEAMEDVTSKEGEISSLQDRLKNESRQRSSESKGRSREIERVAKRLRTLYKNLEVDDRAIADLVALGDESQKLRAEEAMKRLDDDSATAAVRRKVGGLPPHLSIFELGFAGKGRIYYQRSERGGHRVLLLGGKATQKPDLEYLSRLR
jgi:hypothetical protein